LIECYRKELTLTADFVRQYVAENGTATQNTSHQLTSLAEISQLNQIFCLVGIIRLITQDSRLAKQITENYRAAAESND